MELIKIEYNVNQEQIVSARELHGFLEVKTQYSKWFERMCEYGFVENVDYVAISQKRLTVQGNETTYIDHAIKLSMAKELSMIQRTDKGKQARLYFIECENKLNGDINKKLLLADLFSEDKMVVVSAHKALIELEKKPLIEKIEKDKPKVEVMDAVLETEKYFDGNELAKMLNNGMGRNKLFQYMRDEKILRDNNEPYQNYVDNGCCKIIPVKTSRGYVAIKPIFSIRMLYLLQKKLGIIKG